MLLITPPFTQPNTPYPATPYLMSYLKGIGVDVCQVDLGLEVLLSLFSKEGLTRLFDSVSSQELKLSAKCKYIISEKDRYIDTVDHVIAFLQGDEHIMAHRIAECGFLPIFDDKSNSEEEDWAFGMMGSVDKAKHICTCYLEEVGDFISNVVDSHFAFARYGEHLGRSASSFDEIYGELMGEERYIDSIMLPLLEEHLKDGVHDIVGITIPFPGNLYSALRCGAYIKQRHHDVKVVYGGGFVSTELRELSDVRFFEFGDYMILDDGELPLQRLISHLQGEKNPLVRTFEFAKDAIIYHDDNTALEPEPVCMSMPDYRGLPLHKYISLLAVTNPMHRLWSDGRWNKLTLAHGCYWHKCTFCDCSLDYISRYVPLCATTIVDRIEQLVESTGERGFHFVDEALPPALLRDVAREIIARKIVISWWGNIRFEKSFNEELCHLLRLSGCIAVSGGIEVASERILKMINKGVSLSQLSKVTYNLTQADIMVHGYLMYGFPTQTAQETIDSLEVVRQFFENGLLQSAFWHRFALTAHSEVGRNPQNFGITVSDVPFGGFARNDIDFTDNVGCDHSLWGEGLRVSLYNYMQGVGYDMPLKKWFHHKTPPTTIPKNLIANYL
ncbi:MAG: radical SAM protein [Rikenellaceae bacterium]